MRRKQQIILMCFLTLFCFFVRADIRKTDAYVLPPLPNPHPAHMAYFPKLAKLALEKTKYDFGEYKLGEEKGFYASTGRYVRALEAGGRINIMWTMTSEELEERLRAIQVPLLKDANSYRIFLINRGDQFLFDHVNTLDDLKKLRAGQARHWPDTAIMQSNGLPVVTSTEYESLVRMLTRRRYEYFPRGVYEIFEEQKLHPNFEVEQKLALYYEAPIYFFTSKADTQLAERMETGLKRAIADGSFDRLFLSTPGFSRALNEMNNRERRVFRLKVENLPKLID